MTGLDARGGGMKVLRIGLISGIHNLDPSRAQDFVSLLAVSQIYERPFAAPEGAGQAAEPILFREGLQAESADQTAFSAAVRSDVRFSDGTPLSAKILASSLERLTHFKELAEAEPRGDRVYFRLRRPNASFELALAAPYCGVVLERDGALLGTGPYMPASGATPESLRLERNPHYRGTPEIDELSFTCYKPDSDGRPSALLEAFAKSEVDFTNVLHREDISGMRGVRKQFAPGNSTAILYFNTQRPGLGSAEVRRALAKAIDRMQVAKLSYPTNPLAITANSLLPPMMSSYRDGLGFSLEKARAMLAGQPAEVPESLRMMVMFGPRPYLPQPQAVAGYVAAQLGELGIEVAVETTRDSEDYFERVSRGDYDLALTGWIADTLDPVDYLESCLARDAIPVADQPISIHANLARWHNDQVEELLQNLRTDTGQARQEKILALVAEHMPLLPLITGSVAYVHAFGVRNFQPDPLGIPDFSKLDLRAL